MIVSLLLFFLDTISSQQKDFKNILADAKY
jgi:hypothetical protein